MEKIRPLQQGKEKPIERVDLYDENNQPLGKAVTREMAHAEGLWHRTVHIYVFKQTDEGPVLLIHLRSKKKKQYANRFDPVFGGHIKAGQDEHQTALEEFEEEAGVHPDPQRLKYMGFAKKDDPEHAPNDREFNMIFTYELTEEEEKVMRFDPEEVEAVKWLALSQLQKDLEERPATWRPSKDELEKGLSVISSSLK